MLFVKPEKVIREMEDLFKELREKDITNHAKIASAPTLKEKVETGLNDVRKALDKIQNNLRTEVDSPNYSAERFRSLKTQERLLINSQDKLLRLIENKD